MSTQDFVRKQPKPTQHEALVFARSVMSSQGVGEDHSPYKWADGETAETAVAAFEAHAIDTSEFMALEKLKYALEAPL